LAISLSGGGLPLSAPQTAAPTERASAKEKLLQRVRAEECNEANDHHCRIHNQRNQPRRPTTLVQNVFTMAVCSDFVAGSDFIKDVPSGMGLPMFQNELVL